MRQKLLTLGEVLDEEDINEMFKVAEVDKKGRIMYYGMYICVNYTDFSSQHKAYSRNTVLHSSLPQQRAQRV